ncbi:MAG TPA: hypothetical protein VFI02_04230, partial [Armatimonadota bacterium]|nr:hypothetical protein [Armatimonadota bacterium]
MKRLVKVAKVLAVLALIIAVGIGIFDVVLGRRVEKEIMAIKASGAPVAMAELGLPKVPDAENGAIIYAKVIEVLSGGMVLNPKGGKPIKAGTRPEDLGMIIDRFVDAAKRQKDPKLWDEARLIMPKYRRLLPLIEEAASRPACQFAVNWQDGTAALFPHFAQMRPMAKLLEANALLEARDGDMDEAVRSVELSFKVSRSLKDDPSIIGELVRIAVLRMSCQSLREILQYGSISEAQARRLDSTLSQPGMLPSFDRAMQGERCFGFWAFELVRGTPASLPTFLQGSGGTARFPALWKALGDVWRPISYADELVYLRLMNEEIGLMRRPYREIHSQFEDLDRIPRYAILTRVVFPIFSHATARRDEVMAGIQASRIILGLQAYKDRYGYYPANLNALKSQLGWTVPTDPFSGKDFIYKPQGNGFVLYSVGENLKDDGMRPYPPPPRAPGSPSREGYTYENAKGEKVAD